MNTEKNGTNFIFRGNPLLNKMSQTVFIYTHTPIGILTLYIFTGNNQSANLWGYIFFIVDTSGILKPIYPVKRGEKKNISPSSEGASFCIRITYDMFTLDLPHIYLKNI